MSCFPAHSTIPRVERLTLPLTKLLSPSGELTGPREILSVALGRSIGCDVSHEMTLRQEVRAICHMSVGLGYRILQRPSKYFSTFLQDAMPSASCSCFPPHTVVMTSVPQPSVQQTSMSTCSL